MTTLVRTSWLGCALVLLGRWTHVAECVMYTLMVLPLGVLHTFCHMHAVVARLLGANTPVWPPTGGFRV